MDNRSLITDEEINDILDQHSDWLTYDNVIGIDIEEVYDEQTGNRTIEFVVEELESEVIEEGLKEKTNRGEKEKILKIPEKIGISLHDREESEEPFLEEIYVRVQTVDEIIEDELLETGDVQDEPEGTYDSEKKIDTQKAQGKKRPCPGGYMIRTNGLKGMGSLGTSINYRGKYRLLSNNHVIAKNGNVGEWVYQPVEGIQNNRIVKVTGFDPIKYYSNNNIKDPTYQSKDIAWGDSSTNISSQKVRGIGEVKGLRSPIKGETILVFGGKSEQKRSAEIVSTTYRYRSKGSLGYSFWKNGIKLNKRVTEAGDSGSAYVASKDLKLIGLHRSGNTKHSTGAPL